MADDKLFAAVLFTSCVLPLVKCGVWGDILTIEQNLPILWNNRLQTQNKCDVPLPDSTLAEGVCKTKTECYLTGGVSRGRCGLLTTCCTYERTCGRSSNSKISYFTSGQNPLLTDEMCSFSIIRANENVCQIRLDFLEFDIARPVSTHTVTRVDEYQCSDDYFDVKPLTGIPVICGRNTGQHMYLHLPANMNNISLNVKLLRRSTNLPKWNIKVTQLECPGKQYLLQKYDRDAVKDFSSLAPQGCLQYFTKPSGTIKNFGYDEARTDNIYPSNQQYAMCFKRSEGICGVNFLVNNWNFQQNCQDYLEVPGLIPSSENGKLCEGGQVGAFSSVTPGPLHINFIAASNLFNANTGFFINYDLRNC